MTAPTSPAQSLLDRLEAAEQGSRELDGELGALRHGGDCYALDDRPGFFRVPGCGSISSQSIEARRYTTSVDAALTLIPEDWAEGHGTLKFSHRPQDKYGEANLTNSPGFHPRSYRREHGTAATLPLAICIAALRARGFGQP